MNKTTFALVALIGIGSLLWVLFARHPNQVPERSGPPHASSSASNHLPPIVKQEPPSLSKDKPRQHSPSEIKLSDSNFLASDGKLSPTTVKALELTEEEEGALHQATIKLRKSVAEIARQKLRPDPARSDSTNGINAYVIPAYEKEGRMLLSDFYHDCDKILGVDRSARLQKLFPDQDYFGGFGRRDMLVQFQDVTDDIGVSQVTVKITELDAATGRTIIARSGDIETTGKFIPDIFSIK